MHTHKTSDPLTPLQMIYTQYRSSDHETQGDLRNFMKTFLDLKNNIPESKEEICQQIRKGKSQLMEIKKNLFESSEEQSKLYKIMRKRIEKHEALKRAENGERCEFQRNADVMQNLISHGEIKKARKFASSLNQESMFVPQINLIERALQISKKIANNDLRPVTIWVQEHTHSLSKIDNSVHFELTCCEFINFILLDQTKAACLFLRDSLAGTLLTKDQHFIVEKLTYMLVDAITKPPRLDFYLQRLLNAFRKAFQELYSITFEDILPQKLAVGFSVLKSVCCGKKQKRNQEVCPICVNTSIQVSSHIPMLTKEGSSLKCRVNGSIMNHENYPVALPSKHIYSISALQASEKPQEYYCSVTETYYQKNSARKVFLA